MRGKVKKEIRVEGVFKYPEAIKLSSNYGCLPIQSQEEGNGTQASPKTLSHLQQTHRQIISIWQILSIQVLVLLISTSIILLQMQFVHDSFQTCFRFLWAIPLEQMIIVVALLRIAKKISFDSTVVEYLKYSSLSSLTFFGCLWIAIYLIIFQDLFALKFIEAPSKCVVNGIRTTNLFENEIYSELQIETLQKGKDDQFQSFLGIACLSDKLSSNLLYTNILPFRFITYNETYVSFDKQELHRYTFSKMKLPTWLCENQSKTTELMNDTSISKPCLFADIQINDKRIKKGRNSTQETLRIYIYSKLSAHTDALVIFVCLIQFPLCVFSLQYPIARLVLYAVELIAKSKRLQHQQCADNLVQLEGKSPVFADHHAISLSKREELWIEKEDVNISKCVDYQCQNSSRLKQIRLKKKQTSIAIFTLKNNNLSNNSLMSSQVLELAPQNNRYEPKLANPSSINLLNTRRHEEEVGPSSEERYKGQTKKHLNTSKLHEENQKGQNFIQRFYN